MLRLLVLYNKAFLWYLQINKIKKMQIFRKIIINVRILKCNLIFSKKLKFFFNNTVPNLEVID